MDFEQEYRAPSSRDKIHESNPFSSSSEGNNTNSNYSINQSNGVVGSGGGFVVKGAPWEQKAPDTASTAEFPSFGNSSMSTPTHNTSWGPRR